MGEKEEDYEVHLLVKILDKEIVTAKSKEEAIETAEDMFLDNITRKLALEIIAENLTTEKVINERGEAIKK